MHVLDVILMHISDVLIRMHILDVLLLLLLATTVIAPLFCGVQPQSNNVVVPKTMVLSLTMVVKHKYVKFERVCKPFAKGVVAPAPIPGGADVLTLLMISPTP